MPYHMEKSGTQDSCKDVHADGCVVSDIGYQAAKENLCHPIVGVDVKKVDGIGGGYSGVDLPGNNAAEQIQTGGSEKCMRSGRACVLYVYHACQNSNQDEQNMPQIGVDGQPESGIVHAAGIRESGDSAKQAVAHQKLQQYADKLFVFDPGQHKQDVHGDAAELKGKIPP